VAEGAALRANSSIGALTFFFFSSLFSPPSRKIGGDERDRSTPFLEDPPAGLLFSPLRKKRGLEGGRPRPSARDRGRCPSFFFLFSPPLLPALRREHREEMREERGCSPSCLFLFFPELPPGRPPGFFFFFFLFSPFPLLEEGRILVVGQRREG